MSGKKAQDKDALKRVLMNNTMRREKAGLITREVFEVQMKDLGTMKVRPLREEWKARMEAGMLQQEDEDELENLVEGDGDHTEDEDYEPPLGGQPPPMNPPLPDAVIYHADRHEIPKDEDTFTVTKTVTYQITLGEATNAARAIDILNGLK